MLELLVEVVFEIAGAKLWPYVCRGKIACPQKLSNKKARTRHKIRHKFLEMRETLRTRMLQVCGQCLQVYLRAHLRTHLRQVLRALLAGGVCERDLWEERVAVYRSCFAKQAHTMEALDGTASAVAPSGSKANRTRHLQVTPTKAPATKPRAHAASHGQTTGGGGGGAQAIFGLARRVIQKKLKRNKLGDAWEWFKSRYL